MQKVALFYVWLGLSHSPYFPVQKRDLITLIPSKCLLQMPAGEFMPAPCQTDQIEK